MNVLDILKIGGTAIAVGFIAFLLHNWDVGRIESRHSKELTAQREADNKNCKDQKAISEKASNELQTKLNNNAANLAKYKRLFSNKRDQLSASSASNSAPRAAEQREYAGQNGDDAWLDYGADAQSDRDKLNVCKGFINDIYDLNK